MFLREVELIDRLASRRLTKNPYWDVNSIPLIPMGPIGPTKTEILLELSFREGQAAGEGGAGTGIARRSGRRFERGKRPPRR